MVIVARKVGQLPVTGRTKVLGIIGDPIDHSFSPAMYNAVFQKLKMDAVFLAFRVPKEKVGGAIRGVRALNIQGLSVTIPDKTEVIKYLDDVDPVAKEIAAVNVISNKNSSLKGYNTDGPGAMKALGQNQVMLKGKRILLLGAGGAAKALSYYVIKEAEELEIMNRTFKNAEKLAANLRIHSTKKIITTKLTNQSLKISLKKCDVLINSTSVGLHNSLKESLVNPAYLRRDIVVFDIVPRITKLIKDSENIGAKVINGFDMLVYQGVIAFKIWMNIEPPIDIMWNAIRQALHNG